jgi:stress-induced morphogen
MSTSLKEKVRKAIERSFAGDRVQIEVLQRDRLVVTLVSKSFAGLPSAERKDRVRACLAEQLTKDELALIINVIADTPDEHVAYDETVREPPPPRS